MTLPISFCRIPQGVVLSLSDTFFSVSFSKFVSPLLLSQAAHCILLAKLDSSGLLLWVCFMMRNRTTQRYSALGDCLCREAWLYFLFTQMLLLLRKLKVRKFENVQKDLCVIVLSVTWSTESPELSWLNCLFFFVCSWNITWVPKVPII